MLSNYQLNTFQIEKCRHLNETFSRYSQRTEKTKGDVQAIHKEQVELILNLNRVKDSPYLTDRPAHNPDQVLGTAKETEWKHVDVNSPYDNTQMIQDMNMKKLNII